MKIVLFLLLFFNFAFSDEYRTVAENFLKFKGISKEITSSENLTKDNRVVGEIFYLENGGYIIIPISKSLSPIKAFSVKNSFIAPPFKKFLIEEMSYALDNGVGENEKWSFLLNYKTSNRVLATYTPNTYLLTTTWNQDFPYNSKFPKVGEKQTLTGCVQTAMAQLMKYYNYPNFGTGYIDRNMSIKDENGDINRYETMRAVLSRNYNWELMPDNFDGEYNQTQADEVAYLMRDLAIINGAGLGVAETGASNNNYALYKYLGFSKNYKSLNSNDANFSVIFDVIKEQIDLEQPLLFTLPGHMVVADGYSDDDSGKFVHLNMGWGGANNDFYNLDEDILDFAQATNNSISISYDLKPCSEDAGDCFVNLEENDTFIMERNGSLEENDTIDGNVVTGSINPSDDIDMFRFYLSGETNITRTAPYYNLALYDLNGTLITESLDDNLSATLETGIYFIRLSKYNSSGSAYSWDSMDYNFSVSTTELSSDEIATFEKIEETTISGDLSSLDDIDEYYLYLEGNISIVRDGSGYSFALYDSNGTLLKDGGRGTDNIALNLPLGKYRLVVGFFDTQGYYSILDPQYTDYLLTLFAKPLTDEQIDEVENSLQHLPKLDMELPDIAIDKTTDILLNVYDEDDENVTIEAFGKNDTLSLSLRKNILTITPLSSNMASEVLIRLTSGDDIVERNFTVVTLDEPIGFGNNFIMKGQFIDQDTTFSHKLILDGNCSITGNRGYSNPAFETALFDSGGATVSDWNEGDINGTFDLGEYSVGTRLGGYDYDENMSLYTISVSCFDTNITILDVASILGIDLTDIAPDLNDTNETNTSSFTFVLSQGWNLVSNPTTQDLNISIAFGDSLNYALKFSNGNWEISEGNSSILAGYPTFGLFSPNSGYWLNIGADIDIPLSGDLATCQDFSTLSTGWYLVGSCETTPADIFAQNSNILVIYKFQNGTWEAYGNSGVINDMLQLQGVSLISTIQPTDGFWIYVE